MICNVCKGITFDCYASQFSDKVVVDFYPERGFVFDESMRQLPRALCVDFADFCGRTVVEIGHIMEVMIKDTISRLSAAGYIFYSYNNKIFFDFLGAVLDAYGARIKGSRVIVGSSSEPSFNRWSDCLVCDNGNICPELKKYSVETLIDLQKLVKNPDFDRAMKKYRDEIILNLAAVE